MRMLLPLLLLAAVVAAGVVSGQLQMDYYAESCPKAERIVKDMVWEHVPHAPTLAPSLLRLHFHDCFVHGCDGSVLVKSRPGHKAEMDAPPNDSLRGYEFIESIKTVLENECPGVVSCADIIALVAKEATGVLGGPQWPVQTGRRDGRVSTMKDAVANLPSPFFSFSQLLDRFQEKGLDLLDLVWLSGAHTVGVADCGAFGKRLYNFTGKGGPDDADPLLDPLYAARLREGTCKTPEDDDTTAELDPGSFLTFDTDYYKLLLKHRGLLHSDAALLTNPTARDNIVRLATGSKKDFFGVFAKSMEKLGRVGVKVGTEGEIRKVCSVVN